MRTLRQDLDRQLAALPAVVEGESMFADRAAYWVDGKEIAHIETDGEADTLIEVRLTKAVIRGRRAEFKADPRVELRPSGADWIAVYLRSPGDVAFVLELVTLAVEAHLPPPGTPVKPPPTGADLRRRKRFH